MFIVEEQPDHFLDTAFDYSDEFNCRVYQKPGKLPTHWKSQVPTEWKRSCILGDLHRAKRISSNFDQEVRTIKKKYRDAGYPTRFVSSTIDNFIHKQDKANEKLIPDFLFDERKKISIQLPFCERNEKLSKKFTAKLNSFTDSKYSVHILRQTRKIKSIFKLKPDKTSTHPMLFTKATVPAENPT